MENTLYENFSIRQIPREQLIQRMNAVIRDKLTELQRYTLLEYYYQEKSMSQIARERGVNKSTVCRTLKRAKNRLVKYMQQEKPLH